MGGACASPFKTKKMKLPKPHLSVSQVEKWHSNRWEYFRTYFHNIPTEATPEMEFGKWFADQMERLHLGKPVSEGLPEWVHELPRLDIAEYKVETLFANEVPMLGYIDTLAADKTRLFDYKTGQKAWTPSRVADSLQLKTYSLAIYLETGEIPECGIIWAETKKTKAGVNFTGRVEQFTHRFEMAALREAEKHIHETAIEIASAWDHFQLTYLGAARLERLLREIAELEKEIAEIRADLQSGLERRKLVAMDYGNLSLQAVNTTKWQYSPYVEEAEEKLKLAKKEEQDHGIAIPSTSTTWKMTTK